MGRYYPGRKATVEESCDLSIYRLKKWGMLKAGHTTTVVTWVSSHTGKESRIGLEVNMTGEPHAKLTYSVTDGEGNTTPYDSKVDLITTPCNLGGVRYWFACPWCGRRVGGLYLSPGEYYFKCRRCCNLSYRSRNREAVEAWGHTSRQIEKLYGEIRRWTWRGRPTRKVRRLRALERKMGILSPQISARLERLGGRLK
jgi:hypothetical protein